MATNTDPTNIRLPRAWPTFVKTAVLHAISLARLAFTGAWGLAATESHRRARRSVEIDRLESEIAHLHEELRIKDARMSYIAPQCRPRYSPEDRLAILKLKAARGWSAAETARRFLIQPSTICYWLKRLDEIGEKALLRTKEPVNEFPQFVGYLVRRCGGPSALLR